MFKIFADSSRATLDRIDTRKRINQNLAALAAQSFELIQPIQGLLCPLATD
ncbi:hypothetical protein D3C78_1825200 [compost metagenome]